MHLSFIEQKQNEDANSVVRCTQVEDGYLVRSAEKVTSENKKSDDMYKNVKTKTSYFENTGINIPPDSSEVRNSVKDEIEELDCLLEDLLKEVNKPIYSAKNSINDMKSTETQLIRPGFNEDVNADYCSRQASVPCQRLISSASTFPVVDDQRSKKPSVLFMDGVTPINSGYISCGNKSRRSIKLFRLDSQPDSRRNYSVSPRSYVHNLDFRDYTPDAWRSTNRKVNCNKISDNKMFALQKMRLKSPSSSRMDLSVPPQNSNLRYCYGVDGYETDSCIANRQLYNFRNHSCERYQADGYETDSVITRSGRYRMSRTLPYHMHTIPETVVVNNQLHPYYNSKKVFGSGYESDSSGVTRLVPIHSISSPKFPHADMSERPVEVRTVTEMHNNNNIPIHMDVGPSTTNEVQLHEAPSQIVDAVYSKTKSRGPAINKKSNQAISEEAVAVIESKKASKQSATNTSNRKPEQKIETCESTVQSAASTDLVPTRDVPKTQGKKDEPFQNEGCTDVIFYHPSFVKEYINFWYKPKISREEAIKLLKDKKPGSFIIRDSVGFPGAYGLAMKVLHPPPHVQIKPGSDPANELVRHYLIEPTPRGVRLKGCTNEPVYVRLKGMPKPSESFEMSLNWAGNVPGSILCCDYFIVLFCVCLCPLHARSKLFQATLAALVYQHSLEPIALPCRLLIPDSDPVETNVDSAPAPKTPTQKISPKSLLDRGAACNVIYLMTMDVESSTGKSACAKAIDYAYSISSSITPTVVHFKVSSHGITITDVSKRLFLRRHYPVESVLHCCADYDKSRFWSEKYSDIRMLTHPKCFAFISKKIIAPFDNECHVFAEYDPKQPASAIVNFVSKVMLGSAQV